MDAFLISLFGVAFAEIGDKTQLLAFVLAVRFRAPMAVIAGIFVATIFNHLMAGYVGIILAEWLTETMLSWILALSFFAMGIWMLIPDKLDDDEAPHESRFGPFLATTIAFFLVEMGDKTQIATAAFAARFQDLWLVVAGTTAGMMLADVPAVFLGEKAASRIPMQLVRGAAAAIFMALGAVALLHSLGAL
ncbi:MAG: UPF0016 domain-containing protein [Rhizobiales bacterium]|nr:UPF0016 domain-containing protein [Hyphomicrobiales bacterium]